MQRKTTSERHPKNPAARYKVLKLAGWFSLMLGTSACFPASPTCEVAAIDLRYTYSTTCSKVANDKEGPFVWKLDASSATQRQTEKKLTQQLSDQGLEVEDVVLRWEPNTCSDENKSTPQVPAGIVRIVLTPTPSSDTGVSILLVCRPIGEKDTKDLKRDMLLACYRGPSKSVDCTFRLKLQP